MYPQKANMLYLYYMLTKEGLKSTKVYLAVGYIDRVYNFFC